MKTKKKCFMIVLILALFAGISFGQEKIKFPFTGKVTGDNVNVRSGPDINYYSTVRLMKGNLVEVAGQEYNWYKIVPPEGSFSWVAKSCVEKVGKNKGVISRDRVAIRAGSKFTSRKTAIQMIAKKGLEIEILGDDGEYYKITPPQGAYLWISVDYVKPVVEKQLSKVKVKREDVPEIVEAVATSSAP